MRIYLIGFMGAGKSFIGKQLANDLDLDFLDLDPWLEENEGMSIKKIFEEKGEPFFRGLEAEYLRKTISLHKIVIATGGGTPCFNKNLDWMNNHGLTVYLKADVEVLANRLENEPGDRPLLQNKSGPGLIDRIKGLIDEREAFYGSSQICYEIVSDEQETSKELAFFLSRFLKGSIS